MERVHVDSTRIRSIGYSAADRVLEVEFVRGAIYHYEDVPRRIYDDLVAAAASGESVGQVFQDSVVGYYPYYLVGTK